MWQEISDNSTLYGRLWKFGIRALKSRECGLYEASDLLLGDHLLEKSETIQYITVGMPHKRRRRLKNHSDLKELAETNPESEDIFMEDVIGTHYSKRPNSLDDLYLHDFVANYDRFKKDSDGKRVYRKLTKPRIVSHKLFDPQKEHQREDTSTLCCFYLCPSGVKRPCSKKTRLQRMHSVICFLLMATALPTMLGCRQC